MIRLLAFLLMLLCSGAQAKEEISICFNYDCLTEETAVFSERQLASVKRMLQAASSPVLERKILANVIGQLYAWAGQQTPIYADRGGNMADNGVRGGMDCLDHSTTTTRFLKMLAQRGWLRFHRVDEVVRRSRLFIFEHYAASIEVTPVSWLPSFKLTEDLLIPEMDETIRFVVDSWFVNNGEAAVILPLDDWMDGAGPDVEPE